MKHQSVLKEQTNKCTNCSSIFSSKENLTTVAMNLNNAHETNIRQLLKQITVDNVQDKNEHLDKLVFHVKSNQQDLENNKIEFLKTIDHMSLSKHSKSLVVILPNTLEVLDVNKKALTSMQSIIFQQRVQITSLKEKNQKGRILFNGFNELDEHHETLYKTDAIELDDAMDIIKDTVRRRLISQDRKVCIYSLYLPNGEMIAD